MSVGRNVYINGNCREALGGRIINLYRVWRIILYYATASKVTPLRLFVRYD